MKKLLINFFYSFELFLHVNLVILLGFLMYKGNESYFNLDHFYRFDSGHYLRIAEAGYEYFNCFEKFGENWNKIEMCGNTGWFPGYSIIVRYANFVVQDLRLSAYIVSIIFLLLSLMLMYDMLQKYKISRVKQHLLVLAGCMTPGFIYYFSMFPISAVIFFNTLCIYSYINNRPYVLCIAAFLGALCYPTSSFVIIPILLDYIFFNQDNSDKLSTKSIRSLLLIMSVLIGLALVVYYMYTYSHDVLAYFRVAHKYGNKLHFPFPDILNQFNLAFETKYEILRVRHYQTVFVIIGYLLLLNDFIFNKKYKNQIDRIVIVYLGVYIFLPWSLAGDLSSYRSEALLFPFVLYLRHVDWKYMVIILATFIFLGVQLSYLFFDSKII